MAISEQKKLFRFFLLVLFVGVILAAYTKGTPKKTTKANPKPKAAAKATPKPAPKGAAKATPKPAPKGAPKPVTNAPKGAAKGNNNIKGKANLQGNNKNGKKLKDDPPTDDQGDSVPNTKLQCCNWATCSVPKESSKLEQVAYATAYRLQHEVLEWGPPTTAVLAYCCDSTCANNGILPNDVEDKNDKCEKRGHGNLHITGTGMWKKYPDGQKSFVVLDIDYNNLWRQCNKCFAVWYPRFKLTSMIAGEERDQYAYQFENATNGAWMPPGRAVYVNLTDLSEETRRKKIRRL